jgi:DNA-binding NtrC family response regulator
MLLRGEAKSQEAFTERELLYKVLFDMKKDMNDMKLLINEIMQGTANDPGWKERHEQVLDRLRPEPMAQVIHTHEPSVTIQAAPAQPVVTVSPIQDHEDLEESLSLEDKEKEFIRKALQKHKGRRKLAAKELGISERTLYRKMNEYGIH